MGEWRCSFTFLDLGTRWRWVVSFMPRPLYSWRKNSQYPWLPCRMGRGAGMGAMENWKIPCRKSNPCCPVRPLSYLESTKKRERVYFRAAIFFFGYLGLPLKVVLCKNRKNRRKIWLSLKYTPLPIGSVMFVANGAQLPRLRKPILNTSNWNRSGRQLAAGFLEILSFSLCIIYHLIRHRN
jgi:hypothetical protein